MVAQAHYAQRQQPPAPGLPPEVALLLDCDHAQLLRQEFPASFVGANTLHVAESVVLVMPLARKEVGAMNLWLLAELGFTLCLLGVRVAGHVPVLALLGGAFAMEVSPVVAPRVEG